MEQVGYKLVDAQGNVIQSWGGTWGITPPPPAVIYLPNGDHVHCPEPGADYGGHNLVPWLMAKPVQTVFDGLTFLARLTDEEYGAILLAAQTDVQLARWLDMVRLANAIDVTSAVVLAAKAGVVQLGLITPARADVIFATA